MNVLLVALRNSSLRQRLIRWSAIAPIGIVLLGMLGCSQNAPLEEIDGGWVRLNGSPGADNPRIEIGCVVDLPSPSLAMAAGSDAENNERRWTVQIGDWSTEDRWDWTGFPGQEKDRKFRTPERPLEFEIFDQMMNSDADHMTIMMDATYTFSLTEEVRAELRERFPEHCYKVPETLADRYRMEGESFVYLSSPNKYQWGDGSHWEDGISHELPDLPLPEKAMISEHMTCTQAHTLRSATRPYDPTAQNSDRIRSEWERRYAKTLWGDNPLAVTWLRQETFADWCGDQRSPMAQ